MKWINLFGHYMDHEMDYTIFILHSRQKMGRWRKAHLASLCLELLDQAEKTHPNAPHIWQATYPCDLDIFWVTLREHSKLRTKNHGNPQPSFLEVMDPYFEGLKASFFHGFGVQGKTANYVETYGMIAFSKSLCKGRTFLWTFGWTLMWFMYIKCEKKGK